MKREAIEKWYAGQKIPRRKGIVFRAIEDCDRLILGVYRRRERIGIYILNPNGNHAVKRKNDPWSSGGTYTLFDWSWYWGSGGEAYDNKNISWADPKSKEIGERLLATHKTNWSYAPNTIRHLQQIEEKYNEEKRAMRAYNKARRIQTEIDSLPDLPENLYDWAERVVFEDAHYLFGKKGQDKYFCTACEKVHEIKGLKDRQTITCPDTGKYIKVEKRTDFISRDRRVMVLQNLENGSCAVSRHIEMTRTWSRSGTTITETEQMVLFLPKDGRTSCNKWYYHCLENWTGTEFWTDRNKGNYQIRREYLYPYTVKEALQNTVYDRLGLEIAAARGWEINYNRLMMAWRYGQTEYLIKGGFRQLTLEIADLCHCGCYANCICEVGSNINETLMLDGQRIARLKQANGGIGYLRWLRIEMEHGEKFSEETLRWLGKNFNNPHELDFIAGRMHYNRIANYLRVQQSRNGLSITNLVTKWSDYMRMATQLHLDVSKEAIYRPKDLKAKHDELHEIIEAQRNVMERKRIEETYPAVIPTCERIKPLYEWSDGTYLVSVPNGAADIMREGRLQNHCVGTSDRYFDRIAEGESYIMFLRKCKDPEAPWYTMEVEPGGAVRQLRTIGDDEGKDRAEAKAVLQRWKRDILKRLRASGDAELNAAEVSREKRLREFEELRRNGNIIRNGRLAGRLLVEVLESDFKEYNEEIVLLA